MPTSTKDDHVRHLTMVLDDIDDVGDPSVSVAEAVATFVEADALDVAVKLIEAWKHAGRTTSIAHKLIGTAAMEFVGQDD